MFPSHNIPCITLTPRVLTSLCHYKWALPILETNFNSLTPAAWTILEKQSWAINLVERHRSPEGINIL